MSRRFAVTVAVILVATACGGGGDSADVTTAVPTTTPATTTAVPIPVSTSVLATTAAPTTTSSPTQPTTSPPQSGVSNPAAVIPVGPDGIEYRGGGDDLEITGPNLLTIDPSGGVHIVDPVGARLLSFAGDGQQEISLPALDIFAVAAIASNPDHLVLVEVFFGPERHRVHRVGYDGTVVETIDLPVGFRLEDGLSGVLSGEDGEIILEFEGGVRYATWDSAVERFQPVDAMTIGSTTVRSLLPDLEINGDVATSDLVGDFGGLRYLGTAGDGTHVVVRDDVLATTPEFVVLTTVEWYSGDLELLGSARVPTLGEHVISQPPGVAMSPDGRTFALLALEDRVELIELERVDGRITE